MIRTLPALIHDDKNPEDVGRGEDHAADELRYFLQALGNTRSHRSLTPSQRQIMEIRRAKGLDYGGMERYNNDNQEMTDEERFSPIGDW